MEKMNRPRHDDKPPPEADDVKELSVDRHYKIFRDYIEHEDALIHNRLSWNFTIQAFLFATYGICLQKLLTSDPHQEDEGIRTLLTKLTYYLIPLVGVLVAALSFLGTWAARQAIRQLERDWNWIHLGVEEYRRTGGSFLKRIWLMVKQRGDRTYEEAIKRQHRAARPFLPKLTGGGHPTAHFLGFWSPLVVPWVFLLAWLFLLAFAIWELPRKLP
jgi:hypothetical protein